MILGEQKVLIAGGGGAIGRRLSEWLAAKTSGVVVVDQNRQALQSLQRPDGAMDLFECDLTNDAAVTETIKAIFDKHGEISVLVNCVGYIYSEPLINLLRLEDPRHNVEMWRRTIDVNLNSVFYITCNVVARMVAARIKGCLIQFSSISSEGNVGQSAYSAAKAGVNALTVAWAKELGHFGIRSTAIAPGFFDTESTRRALNDRNLRKWEEATPLGRLGRLEEIQNAVAFIIENDFYNGRVLHLDGGLRI